MPSRCFTSQECFLTAFFPCLFWNVSLLLFSLFVLVLTQSLYKCFSWGIISFVPCILTSLFPHGILVTLRGRQCICLRCQSIWTRIFGGLIPEDSNLLQNIFFIFRIPEKVSTSPNYKYRRSAVRNKEARRKLDGWDCEQCKNVSEGIHMDSSIWTEWWSKFLYIYILLCKCYLNVIQIPFNCTEVNRMQLLDKPMQFKFSWVPS
jgi:hypothetical protein